MVGAIILAGILGIATGTVVIAFWEHIRKWVHQVLLGWLQTRIPKLLPYIEDAFISLDNVITSVRTKAHKAWQIVRHYVFFQKMTITKESNSSYKKEIKSFIALNPQVEEPEVFELTSSKVQIDASQIPPELQRKMDAHPNASIDVNEIRDREFMELGMSV